MALYRGPFLHDFYVPEAPEFEEWMRLEQERLRQLAINALTHLAEEARRHGDFKEGIRVSRQLLTIEPWLEEAHQQLMWMLAYSGQRSAALAQYEACRRALAEELAVEPSAATTQLYQRIKQEAPEVKQGQTLFLSATSPTPGRGTIHLTLVSDTTGWPRSRANADRASPRRHRVPFADFGWSWGYRQKSPGRRHSRSSRATLVTA